MLLSKTGVTLTPQVNEQILNKVLARVSETCTKRQFELATNKAIKEAGYKVKEYHSHAKQNFE